MNKIIISAVAIMAYFALLYTLTQQGERQECAQWAKTRQALTGNAARLFAEDWQTWQTEQCEAVNIRVF